MTDTEAQCAWCLWTWPSVLTFHCPKAAPHCESRLPGSPPHPPNHCFLPPTLLCSHIALICIAAFLPLSMSFYSWPFLLLSVIHRLRGRSLIPQSSRWSIRPLLFLGTQPPPPPSTTAGGHDTCSCLHPPPSGTRSGTHNPWPYPVLMLRAFQCSSLRGCFYVGGHWRHHFNCTFSHWTYQSWWTITVSILWSKKNDDTEESGPPLLTVEFDSSGHFFQTWSALKDRTRNISVHPAGQHCVLAWFFFPVSHMHCPTLVHPLGPVNTCSIGTSSWKLFSVRQQVYGPNFGNRSSFLSLVFCPITS